MFHSEGVAFFRNRGDFPVTTRICSVHQQQAKKRRAACDRTVRKVRCVGAQDISVIDRSIVNLYPVLLKRKQRARNKMRLNICVILLHK